MLVLRRSLGCPGRQQEAQPIKRQIPYWLPRVEQSEVAFIGRHQL